MGVEVGAEFFESWRVNTLEKSRAQLGFRDDTELQMTENTLVVIYGPSSATARATVSKRATVERGRLKASLSGLSGSPVEVETPSAQASLSRGKGQITVDDDGESRFANHGGDAIEVSGSKGPKVAVNAGQGTRVEPGRAAEPPRPLPKTPTWSSDFAPFGLTLGNSPGVVRARWNPVDSASSYYVEVTRSARGLDVLTSQNVPATIDTVELRGLPVGEYSITIVAIDADRFESIPSTPRTLSVVSLPVSPTAIVDADQRRVLLGADVGSPPGYDCEARNGADSISTVECVREGVSAALGLEVVTPTVSVVGERSIVTAPGELESLELQFEPAVPGNVSVDSPEGLSVKMLKVRPDALRLNISPDAELAPGTLGVTVRSGDVALHELEVEVETRATSSSTATDSARVFATAVAGYDALTVAPYWPGDIGAIGGTAEVGIGVLASDRFGAELRLGYGAYNGSRGTDGQIVARANALVGAFDTTIAPYGTIGIGWRTWPEESSRASAQVGVGLMPEMTDELRLRGELNLAATPVDATVRLLPEARVGIVYTF
jgi:hypothetical protein